MATLQERLNDDWKAAMRAGDALRKETVSGLRAAVKRAEIDARSSASEGMLDDDDVQKVIEREAKKRRDAIEEYTKANRPDRAEQEASELKILQEYLPAQMDEAELETLVRAAIGETGAESPKDMGRLMSALMPRVAGRADGKTVNAIVRRLLAK